MNACSIVAEDIKEAFGHLFESIWLVIVIFFLQPLYIPPRTTKASGYFYPVPTVRFELPAPTRQPVPVVTYLPPTTPVVNLILPF